MNQYLAFSGNGQAIIPDIHISGPFTATWRGFATDTTNINPLFALKDTSSNEHVGVGFDEGRLKIFSDGRTPNADARVHPMSVYFEVAMVWDGTELTLFLDNEFRYSVIPSNPGFISTLDTLYLCGFVNNPESNADHYFDGGFHSFSIEGLVDIDANDFGNRGQYIGNKVTGRMHRLEGTWPTDNSHWVQYTESKFRLPAPVNPIGSTVLQNPVQPCTGADTSFTERRVITHFSSYAKSHLRLRNSLAMTKNFEVEAYISTGISSRASIFACQRDRTKGVFADVTESTVRFFIYRDGSDTARLVETGNLNFNDGRVHRVNFRLVDGIRGYIFVDGELQGATSSWDIVGTEEIDFFGRRDDGSSYSISGVLYGLKIWHGNQFNGSLVLDAPLNNVIQEGAEIDNHADKTNPLTAYNFVDEYSQQHTRLPSGDWLKRDGTVLEYAYDR